MFLSCVTFGPGRAWTHDPWMATDPESALTHEEILERFRRLFNRDEERRVFFLLEATEEGISWNCASSAGWAEQRRPPLAWRPKSRSVGNV